MSRLLSLELRYLKYNRSSSSSSCSIVFGMTRCLWTVYSIICNVYVVSLSDCACVLAFGIDALSHPHRDTEGRITTIISIIILMAYAYLNTCSLLAVTTEGKVRSDL